MCKEQIVNPSKKRTKLTILSREDAPDSEFRYLFQKNRGGHEMPLRFTDLQLVSSAIFLPLFDNICKWICFSIFKFNHNRRNHICIATEVIPNLSSPAVRKQLRLVLNGRYQVWHLTSFRWSWGNFAFPIHPNS